MDGDLRVGIVGAGATGGYLAAVLIDAGYEVTLFARSRSAEAIRARGLRLVQRDGNAIAVKPAAVVEPGDPVDPVDVTIFCVKTYDTEVAASASAPLAGDHSAVLCLQNGIASEDILAGIFGSERLLSGVFYIGAERLQPGLIHCSTAPRIIFGPYDPAVSSTRELWPQLASLLSAAGVETTIDEDVRQAKWQKFLFNCALNPLTALTRQRLGMIRAHPAGRDLYTRLAAEALEAATAAGAPVPTDALVRVESTGDRMDISSSMAEDLEAGRAMELDAFSGHVLRLAERHGLPAPVTAVVHQLLEVLDRRREQPVTGGA